MVSGVVGLGITLWFLGESLASVTRLPFWAVGVGAALVAVNYLAGGARLHLLSRMVGHPISLSGSIRAYALGLFSAAATPGNAGQAPAVVLSFTSDGMVASRAWSLNFYVWILDLVFLAYSLPVSLLLLGSSTRLLSFTNPWLLAGIAVAAPLALLWLLIYRLPLLTRWTKTIFRIRWLRRWHDSISQFLARFETAIGELRGGITAQRVALHVLTALVYFSTLFTFYVMVVSMQPATPLFLTIAIAQIPMALSTFFPTPGGAGLLEILTASLMVAGSGGIAGDRAVPEALSDDHTSGTIAAAILGWRLLTYYSRFLIAPALGAARLGMKRPGGSGPPRHDTPLDELQESGETDA